MEKRPHFAKQIICLLSGICLAAKNGFPAHAEVVEGYSVFAKDVYEGAFENRCARLPSLWEMPVRQLLNNWILPFIVSIVRTRFSLCEVWVDHRSQYSIAFPLRGRFPLKRNF